MNAVDKHIESLRKEVSKMYYDYLSLTKDNIRARNCTLDNLDVLIDDTKDFSVPLSDIGRKHYHFCAMKKIFLEMHPVV